MAFTNAEKQARWRARRDAEVEQLRKAAAKAAPEPAKPSAAELHAEYVRGYNAALKGHEIASAEAAAREAKRVAKVKAEAAGLSKDDLAVKLANAERLHRADATKIRNLIKEEQAARKRAHLQVMPLSVFGAISKCLRTDLDAPSKGDRDKAMQMLNDWRSKTRQG